MSAAAVTVAALTGCPPIVHDTVVVELYPTSGWTVAPQLPIGVLEPAARMVKVTVDGAFALAVPPRFLILAETTHGEPHPDVSTDTTV